MCSLNDKKKDVAHIRTSKQALNLGLVLQKVRRVISFNQNVLLIQYIDIITEPKKMENMTL